MSGTSMDGVDVAFLETDGEAVVRPGPTGFMAYTDAERTCLRAALAAGVALTDRDARPASIAAAEAIVTDRHAAAIEQFLARNGLHRDGIDLVGFHGQTVLHRPAERLTVQIGDGAALAKRLGIPIIFDLRAEDVAAGGQGAPLVPVFHQALVAQSDLSPPVAVVNIGGVSNLTFLAAGHAPVAFDTGPGNALLDDLMLARTGAPIDGDGRTAAQGRIDARALDALLAHPFFGQRPPKSLDRNAFSAAPVRELATADAAATLTAFTAETIARSLRLLPAQPRTLVVCGGGARNPTLLAELASRVPCPSTTADAVGWSADALEAQAFGFLAARSVLGLPLTFPTTTGVPVPTRGGRRARV